MGKGKKKNSKRLKLEICTVLLVLFLGPIFYYLNAVIKGGDLIRPRAGELALQLAVFQFSPAQIRSLGDGLFLIKRNYWQMARTHVLGHEIEGVFMSSEFGYSSLDLPVNLEVVQIFCNHTDRCNLELLSARFINLMHP